MLARQEASRTEAETMGSATAKIMLGSACALLCAAAGAGSANAAPNCGKESPRPKVSASFELTSEGEPVTATVGP